MKFTRMLQSKEILFNVFTAAFWLFWLLSLLNIGFGATNRLCDRIYFNHGDETKMPYVQLEGIYHMDFLHNGHPIYKHEQRDYYFEYLYSHADSFMAFKVLDASKLRRSYVGLRALLTSKFKSPNWDQQITDSKQPFHKFIVKWEYYDWQSQTHISITRDAVSLICVPDDVYRCSSQRIYFNTTFIRSQHGMVLHNHLEDYFEELTGAYNDYQNFRKKYRHSRNSDWLLYYESPYWKVINDRSSFNTPFLRVKGSSFRPEYITAPWQYLDGTWKDFSSSSTIRCRGVVQYHRDGSVKSCEDSNPCLNGGTCINSKSTKETICLCRESFAGLRCEKRQKRCSAFLYGENSTKHVVIYGLESSSFASVFCKEKYKPNYFLSHCISTGHSSSWTPRRGCYLSYPSALYVRAPLEEQGTHFNVDDSTFKFDDSRFNFDNYPMYRPILLAIICFLQVLVPCIHMGIGKSRGKSGLRIISIHAFLSYVCWWTYFVGCQIENCPHYGEVLADFTIMSFIMIPLCYLYMLIESCCSAENQYLSSILTDVSAIGFVDQLKRKDPQRVMMVECYHWETRTRTVQYTDSNGNTQTRTETYQERVTTYTEEQVFPICYSQDISDRLELDAYSVTRLKLTPDIDCGDEQTMMKFNEMRQQMIGDNEHRDEYIDFNYSDVIDGFKKRICAYTDPRRRPLWMNLGVFWLSSLFGLTWVFRIIFNCKTRKCEYTIKKLIYCTPRCRNVEPNMPQLHATSNVVFCESFQQIDNIQGSGATAAYLSSTAANQVTIPLISHVTPTAPPPAYEDVVQSNAWM